MSILTEAMINRGVNGYARPSVNSSNELVGNCDNLKHFWCVHGAASTGAGTGTVTDAIASVVVEDAASGYFAVNSGNFDIAASIAAPASGTITTIGTKDVLAVVSGQGLNTGAATVMVLTNGASATQEVFKMLDADAGTNQKMTICDDAAVTTVSTAALSVLTASTDYYWIGAVDRSSSTGGHYLRYTSAMAVDDSDVDVDFTSVNEAVANTQIAMSGKIYGAALFTFDALPPDWKWQALYMADQWRQGNYVFPVSWNGR